MLAELLLATSVAMSPVGDSTLPNGVVTRVRDAVAAQWQVPAGRVRLAWSAVPSLTATDSIDIALSGHGGNGWFALTLSMRGRHSIAVRLHAGLADSTGAATAGAGEVVEWGPPRLIAAGDSVRISWQAGDVAVTLTGTALRAARFGEILGVRVEQRRLTAIVTGAGTARLQGRTP